MKMKMLSLCLIASASAVSANALAIGIDFSGSVTKGTCNLEPNFPGAAIDLGAIKVGAVGDDVPFVLKGKGVDCATLAGADGKLVSLTWTSPKLNATGFDGGPKGASVLLKPQAADSAAAANITATNTLNSFPVAQVLTGVTYHAQLVSIGADATEGLVNVPANYQVTYN